MHSHLGMDGLMRLSELLRGAGLKVANHADPEIREVRIDSRKVAKGDLFLALKGAHDDGSKYVGEAIARGAAAILSEGNTHPALDGAMEPGPGAEIIPCPSLRAHVGDLFNVRLGRPSETMETVAVTGTNGKSTITKLTAGVLQAAGHKVISLGTIDYAIDGIAQPSSLTTPGPDDFFGMLRQGADRGCTALAMEVSSHALSQDRIRGVTFSRAIFTNLTRDHMDYHKDFEDYYQAKKRLFSEYLKPGGVVATSAGVVTPAGVATPVGVAILNVDSEYGIRLSRELTCPRLTFSRGETKADVMLTDDRLTLAGTEFEVAYRGEEYRFTSRLIGTHGRGDLGILPEPQA